MPTVQPFYRFAWVLDIYGPATIRSATTDLPEKAAVTTLGAFYTKRIKNIDTRIVDSLPNQFYGVRRITGASFVLNNSDQAIDPGQDWRGASFLLRHYDRELDAVVTDLEGVVTEVAFANGTASFALGTVDEAILSEPLPAATINPVASSPCETAASAGVPIPVVFGNDVLVKPPNIAADQADADGGVSHFDYAVGFGSDLRVSTVWGDWDQQHPGLERYGSWETAPGAPAYFSAELDSHYRARSFTVTGDQYVRYGVEAGKPIRFKTTASGSTYLYSAVKTYRRDSTPHIVEIYDELIDSGLTSVQIVGDYVIDRAGYQSVTAGVLPEPAAGQAMTAVRLYGQPDTAMLAMVSNPSFPSGAAGALPSAIIEEIITNTTWGLSAHVPQAFDAAGIVIATDVALVAAGLVGSVQGALAYDQRQRRAEDVLNAILMFRGMRLGRSAAGKWTLACDSSSSVAQVFSHGPGLERGTRIKRVLAFGRQPIDRAVRNVVLHWSPVARARSTTDVIKPVEYVRFSTKSCTTKGSDLHLYNWFIRSESVAEKVLHYVAEKLLGADEQLVFTAGPEARELVPGQRITCESTVDGFSGDWQITETSKSLSDVQLSCIRWRSEAFDAPSGVTHSAEPTDASTTRTAPGGGVNLLPNPDPAPPVYDNRHAENIEFSTAVGGPVFAAAYQFNAHVPHGWIVSSDHDASWISEFAVNKSETIRAKTVSGHYLRMAWSKVTAGAPLIYGTDVSYPSPRFDVEGITSAEFGISPNTDYLVSFYGDAADGWYVVMTEDDEFFYNTVITLTRDSTDVDGNGWTRFYGRWRSRSTSTRAIMAICVSKAGTYQLSSMDVRQVSNSMRKPPPWARHRAIPSVLTRAKVITLDGSSTYTAPLIKAGDYALGATLRVLGEIHFGTATQFRLGTPNDPEIWARNITDPFALTTSANFKAGTVATYFAYDTNVVLDFLQADNVSAGTATSGQVRIVYSYTQSPPTPGQ